MLCSHELIGRQNVPEFVDTPIVDFLRNVTVTAKFFVWIQAVNSFVYILHGLNLLVPTVASRPSAAKVHCKWGAIYVRCLPQIRFLAKIR